MSKLQSISERALQIWKAGVAAVDSESLVSNAIQLTENQLTICGHSFNLQDHQKLLVVGAGKAGSGMAAGVEAAIKGSDLEKRTTGWVNVPADCVRSLSFIHLHAARPASLNEPTADGVYGSLQILEQIANLKPDDLCLVLISGGGSALLPAPLPPVTLDDKQAITRLLMSSGATIQELNCVRKHLSQVKGGRLAQAATCNNLVVLIISDVVGDPLEVIASGPTVTDTSSSADAVEILHRLIKNPQQIPTRVWDCLKAEQVHPAKNDRANRVTVENHVIGSNRTALDTAKQTAQKHGYEIYSLGSENEGTAVETGIALAELCLKIRDNTGPISRPACILSGGEPVVDLSSTPNPGKGGRNQEVVLAAMQRLWNEDLSNICILSAGTDGEDGPTDAAGGILDSKIMQRAHELQLETDRFLRDHNSYPCLSQVGGLLKTGATQTNVMDLRVALVE